MQPIRTFIVAALWLACQTAQAQWQWLDKDGRKVFSDLAPPSDIPARSILKQPGKPAAVASPAPAAASGAEVPVGAASAAPGKPQPSRLDEELETRRKKEEAEKEAKAKAEAERVASARASICARAKQRQAVMDSGVRVSTINAKGEREYLDDAARADENKRIRADIDANCN